VKFSLTEASLLYSVSPVNFNAPIITPAAIARPRINEIDDHTTICVKVYVVDLQRKFCGWKVFSVVVILKIKSNFVAEVIGIDGILSITKCAFFVYLPCSLFD
jgi:hypothetical protein